jgi:hypothetical protein
MSADNREAIMVRLLAVAATVTGINEVARNKPDMSGSKLPAIVLMEGAEDVDEGDLGDGKPQGPVRVTMIPQLVLWVSGKPEEIGTTFNTLRQRLIKAVLNDTQLIALTLNGRRARYAGVKGPMIAGEMVFTQMVVEFRFTYVLQPGQL